MTKKKALFCILIVCLLICGCSDMAEIMETSPSERLVVVSKSAVVGFTDNKPIATDCSYHISTMRSRKSISPAIIMNADCNRFDINDELTLVRKPKPTVQTTTNEVN
jgi:PBP1b-binding outer membrane lipoprotein LpoB